MPSLGYTNYNEENDLTYTLTYLENNKNCLDINVHIKGNNSGKLILRTPPYAANIQFSTKGNLNYKSLAEHVYEFTLNPNNNLVGHYQACHANATMNIHKPIVESDIIHFKTNDFLVTPETYDGGTKHFKILFNNFPEKFIFASSETLDDKKIEMIQSVEDFRSNVIVGSNHGMKKIRIKNNPVYLLTKGKWSYFNKDISYYLKKIISTQRDFWHDHNFPHYVVVFIQHEAPKGEKVLMGTHHKNVMSMVLPDGDKNKLPLALHSISHELFHAWLGFKIKIPLPQGDLQWFFEGITDYYGLAMLKKSGLITQNDYIKIYNDHLKSYSLSPLSFANNREIAKNYFLNDEYGHLATLRGHIIFKELNHKIEKNTPKENSLDSALKEVLNKFGNKQASQLTADELDKIFIPHVNKENWFMTKAYIDGKPILFSPDLFKHDAILINKLITAPNFGLDVEKLIKQKKIKSLQKKSVAYSVGLRENQKILDSLLDFSDPDRKAQILISEKGEPRIVKFKPDTTKKYIPQYKLFNSEA